MVNEHLKYIDLSPELLTEWLTDGIHIIKVTEGLSKDFKPIGMEYIARSHMWRIVFSDGKHTEGSTPEQITPLINMATPEELLEKPP